MIGKNQPNCKCIPTMLALFFCLLILPLKKKCDGTVVRTGRRRRKRRGRSNWATRIVYASMVKWSPSIAGGDNGGTAASWNAAAVSVLKTFLTVIWFFLLLPIFLEGRDSDATARDELLLPMVDKNFSFEMVDGADAMIELKTPDSRRPCIMTWEEI